MQFKYVLDKIVQTCPKGEGKNNAINYMVIYSKNLIKFSHYKELKLDKCRPLAKHDFSHYISHPNSSKIITNLNEDLKS